MPKTDWIPMRIVYGGKCSKRHGGCGRTLSAGTAAWGLPRGDKRRRWYFICAKCGALKLHPGADEFAAKFPDHRTQQLAPGDRL
jgi:hypothetical protein